MDDLDTIRGRALEACQRWRDWLNADGFDNPQYDPLFEAMDELAASVGIDLDSDEDAE